MKNAIIVLLAGAVVFGCSQKQEPQAKVEPTPRSGSEETPAVTAAPQPVATVAFMMGQARRFTQGAWQPVAMNNQLLAADSLDIPAKAQLELKTGDDQKAKIGGPQKGLVSVLLAGNAVAQESGIGKTASAIKKLQAKPTMTVQTPTSVAAVRGTNVRRTVSDTTKKDSTKQ